MENQAAMREKNNLVNIIDTKVNTGSLIITTVPLWHEMLTGGEVVHVWGQGAYENSILHSNFFAFN